MARWCPLPGNGPRLPRHTVRILAIEALLFVLPRGCRGFVSAVRANVETFKGLSSSDPRDHWAAIEPFGAWLVQAYPALGWLRRSDGLRPPFASDNGLGAFTVGAVPWILAGALGEPPRTRLEWERQNVVVDLPYRDWINFLNSNAPNSNVRAPGGPETTPDGNVVVPVLAHSAALAPLVLEIGESEREFLARARAHARARQRDLEAYLTNDPTHPLHVEDARLCSSGWRHESRRCPETAWQYRPRQLELHATWWALHHVEGQQAAEIAGQVEDVRNVEKGIAKMSEYYR
jgi:hypothetical protein